MARIAAKNANFSYSNVDIEDELNSIELGVDVNLPEVTAFADDGTKFVEGLPDSKFSLAGSADFAASQGDATLFGQIGSGSAAYVFQPTGASAGGDSPNYTGNGFVKSYRLRCEVGGAATYNADIQCDGKPSRDVS